jgi:hypothetical protein
MKYFLVLFLLIISFWNYSQTYSANREKFVKEFQKVLSDYGKGDFLDFVKKELAPNGYHL